MWDGDGVWRDAKPAAALPPVENKCQRLLAAASVFSQKAKEDGDASTTESPLALEVTRLVRSFGAAHTSGLFAKCVDASGATVAHVAARVGDLAGLATVVSVDPGSIHAGDARNVAPLSLAAWRGNLPVVDYLLRNGADANRRDDYGVAALHKAVGHGHLKTVMRIVGDGGCDVNLVVGSIHESVPSSYGAQSKHQTALHVACRRDDGDDGGTHVLANSRMVKELLRHGADPNALDVNNQTPLHHAVQACDCATVRLLTRAGATVDAEDATNRTPYDLLVERLARNGESVKCNRGLLLDILRTKGAV